MCHVVVHFKACVRERVSGFNIVIYEMCHIVVHLKACVREHVASASICLVSVWLTLTSSLASLDIRDVSRCRASQGMCA
jgi:hypothetical protein